MDAQADRRTVRKVLRQGEPLRLEGLGDGGLEVTCDDVAKLALAMRDHSVFFSRRRGLSIRFSQDLNGSGTQGLFIGREADGTASSSLVTVVFSTFSGRGGEYLYEADLITDQRKDYEPTVNRGKHRFVAQSVGMEIDWSSDEAVQWRSDVARLSSNPDTLTGWIEADLEMLVKCEATFLCGGSAVLTKHDLSRHVQAGLSLEDLKTRFTCSKCGKRKARVMVF